ncbi:hypothetical protein ACQUSR_08920 [Streptomyces sp. P1-3]|uniref:hypothetical protein n=1 Tax=Streptomyces sp. P1-3 TaxID=3421658 RepID=UPI003D35F036
MPPERVLAIHGIEVAPRCTGYVSRLADDMEAVQLRMGNELRFLGNRLRESLRDALRIAESRGGRLPAPEVSPPPGTR